MFRCGNNNTYLVVVILQPRQRDKKGTEVVETQSSAALIHRYAEEVAKLDLCDIIADILVV